MPPRPKLGVRIRSPKTEYELLEELNEGNMSWALKARDCNSGETVFLKYYKSPTPSVDWYCNYISYVNELNSRLESGAAAQYCVLCIDQFTANPRPGSMNKEEYFFQVYDFIDKGLDMRDILATNPTWEKRKAMAKVFLACMKKIHQTGVVHCDLKPENVQMLPNASTAMGLIPRLIDMDRSLLNDKEAPWQRGKHKEGYTGTPGYFSPEHLTPGKTPLTSSDVFTVGIILGELLGGRHPFAKQVADKDEYSKAVLAGNQYTPIKLQGSLGNNAANADTFARLIEQCFAKNAAQRPTCEQLHIQLIRLDHEEDNTEEKRKRKEEEERRRKEEEERRRREREHQKQKALVLTGDAGSHTVRIPMEIGKILLTRASADAHYAGRQQFRLEKEGDTWYICPGTAQNQPHTMVNDVVLTERRPLAEGDRICLVGRKSGKKAMFLTCSFS